MDRAARSNLLILSQLAATDRCATIRGMRVVLIVAMVVCSIAAPLMAADPLGEAKRLYNQGEFDAAERAALEAAKAPATADAARVVLGRIQLERFRKSSAVPDLEAAISSLRSVDVRRLDIRDKTELGIGLGEALYLDERYGAAAALFESVLQAATALPQSAYERVLDWWATAVDREAQTRPPAERAELYARVTSRMLAEISRSPGSVPAGYWLAASARASGDPDQAMNEALAAWVRASLGSDRGVALRADLDRLVTEGILPDRAARLPGRERAQGLAAMTADWEAFKTRWTQ
jgi:tetratricopeptide (TPR) repeat protein